MSSKIFDLLVCLAAFVLPLYFVLRLNKQGIFWGALLHWVILALEGYYLSIVNHQRGVPITDGLWLFAGWLQGLIYCLLIYLFKHLYLKFFRKSA